jgi:carbon-monoxide dehydrogenase large subunit
MIGTNRYIGSPVERIEDLCFLRGRGEFVGDLRRDGMLHAAILRSPIAHGRLRGLDATAARAMAGVRAVITAAEIGSVPRIPLRLLPLPGTERFPQPSSRPITCAMSASRSRSSWPTARRSPRTESG